MSRDIKDKKIEIFYDAGKINKLGENTHNWISRGKYWAYSRMLSMREFREYGMDTHEIDRLFILNYHEEIKPSDHIIYQEKEFEIYSIDTLNDNKQDMKVYVTNVKPRRIGV